MPRARHHVRHPTMHFHSKEAYRKWLAYDKIHVSPGPSSHPVKVYVAGKPHPVQHYVQGGKHHKRKYR